MICSSENLDRFIACLLIRITGYPQSEDISGEQVRLSAEIPCPATDQL